MKLTNIIVAAMFGLALLQTGSYLGKKEALKDYQLNVSANTVTIYDNHRIIGAVPLNSKDSTIINLILNDNQ